jgi:hypothetical protein
MSSDARSVAMLDHPIERPPYRLVPPSDTLGLRHVAIALHDVEFPITTKALLERYGAWRVPITGAHHHRLGEMLTGVRERSWKSYREVLDAIAKAHPELR